MVFPVFFSAISIHLNYCYSLHLTDEILSFPGRIRKNKEKRKQRCTTFTFIEYQGKHLFQKQGQCLIKSEHMDIRVLPNHCQNRC